MAIGIDKITQDLIIENEKARSDEVQKNLTKEAIQQDKIRKSTIESLNLQKQILTNTFNDLSKIISNSDKDITEQLDLLANLIKTLEGGVGSDSLEQTLLTVADAVGDIPNALEVIQKAAAQDRAAQQKISKLREKEAKQDEVKQKFSFQDSIDKVKDVGKSAFAKIKDVLFKGALIAFLLNLPKILNSEAFKPILEYVTGGSFESDIKALWNNVLLPIFNGIVDTIQFIIALFQGDFDTAIQLFKDNWIMIIPILAIAFGSLIATLWGYIAAIAPVIGGFFSLLAPAIAAMWAAAGSMIATLWGYITAIAPIVVGFLAALGPILVAAAPFIAIAALLALAFVAIKLLLDKLVEKLNISSITDLIFIAWGYVQDAFAMWVNFYIDIANMIIGLVNKFAAWLGRDDIELPQFERMSTDNAEKALKAAQLKKAEEDAKKAAEERAKANQQSNIVANSGNTNINTNSSSVTNMLSQGMPEISIPNNFGFDEVMAR